MGEIAYELRHHDSDMYEYLKELVTLELSENLTEDEYHELVRDRSDIFPFNLNHFQFAKITNSYDSKDWTIDPVKEAKKRFHSLVGDCGMLDYPSQIYEL